MKDKSRLRSTFSTIYEFMEEVNQLVFLTQNFITTCFFACVIVLLKQFTARQHFNLKPNQIISNQILAFCRSVW